MRTLAELQRLTGRVAVVTGGAGHLALALEETLVELGARIVVVDVDAKGVEERTRQLTGNGGEAVGMTADLADPASAAAIVERAIAAFGRLDVLVNNAGFTGASGIPGYAVPFPDQTLEAWLGALSVNLTAAFLLCQRARAALEATGHGVVINVGSIYGMVGPDMRLYEGTSMGNPAAYAATKGGLVQLTRYLATVLAPNIRVNTVSPGGIERGQPRAFQERYVTRTPLGRMAREEDFKGVIAFLASDASAYVTGQNFVVDGGWTVW